VRLDIAKVQKYRFLDNIATADIAFEATGCDLPELFENCAQALTEVMVNRSSLSEAAFQVLRLFTPSAKPFSGPGSQADNLLYDFLSELIFLKDTEGFLVKRCVVTINNCQLKAKCYGEVADTSKHKFKVDVKAVTRHEFGIKKTAQGYKARVVLDV